MTEAGRKRPSPDVQTVRCRAQVVDGRDDVAAEVGIGEAGGQGRADPVRGDLPRGVEGLLVGRRDGPVGQVEAGRGRHGLGLGDRVGRQPREVALAELEAVGGQPGGEEDEDQEGGHPVACLTSPTF